MPAPIPADRILTAVLDVWREKGYVAATTAEVARRAGVGEVTLFRRFRDKPGLFAAALAGEAQLLRNLAPQYTGDVELDLLNVARAYDAMLSRNTAIILDFLGSAPNADDIGRIAPSPLVAVNQLALVISQHQAAGSLRGGDPHTDLSELLAPIFFKRLLDRAQPALKLSNDLHQLVHRYLYGRAARNSSGD